MRTTLLTSIAAAALAAAAVATWGQGPPGPRAAAVDRRPTYVVGSGPASQAAVSTTSRQQVIAAPRYRAEACSGDYICDGEGAWEPLASAPGEVFTLTGDGF